MEQNNSGALRTQRDEPPSTFSFEIPSFSSRKSENEKIESPDFEAGDYTWKLIVYPNGNQKDGGEGYISLYLAIQDTASQPVVKAEFKLSAHDQVQNKYLMVQDLEVKQFSETQTQLGFSQFLSLDTFNDPENGYLLNDTCQFGAEVFVIQQSKPGSEVEDPEIGNITWKDENLSDLGTISFEDRTCTKSLYLEGNDLKRDKDTSKIQKTFRRIAPGFLFPVDSFSLLVKQEKDPYESAVFNAGGLRWKLALYPRGRGEAARRNKKISLFLRAADTEKYPSGWEVYAFFRFFIYDQENDRYLMIQESMGTLRRFYEVKKEWGIEELISIDEFSNRRNGYLVDDGCRFGAEVFVVRHSTTRSTGRPITRQSDDSFVWTIENFSHLPTTGVPYYSEPFTIGGLNWKIVVYPNGEPRVLNSLMSLYVELNEPDTFSPKAELKGVLKLRCSNQNSFGFFEKAVAFTFKRALSRAGFVDYIPLGLLADVHGYKKHDTVIVQVVFDSLSMNEVLVGHSP